MFSKISIAVWRQKVINCTIIKRLLRVNWFVMIIPFRCSVIYTFGINRVKHLFEIAHTFLLQLWGRFFQYRIPGSPWQCRKTLHGDMNITYMFDRYRCSLAAVTPAKYQCGSKNLTSAFMRPKISLTEKLRNGALITPPFRNWRNNEIKYKGHLVQTTELLPCHDKIPCYRSVSRADVYRWINWDNTALTFMVWLLSLTTKTLVPQTSMVFMINNRTCRPRGHNGDY